MLFINIRNKNTSCEVDFLKINRYEEYSVMRTQN